MKLSYRNITKIALAFSQDNRKKTKNHFHHLNLIQPYLANAIMFNCLYHMRYMVAKPFHVNFSNRLKFYPNQHFFERIKSIIEFENYNTSFGLALASKLIIKNSFKSYEKKKFRKNKGRRTF